MRRRAPRPAGRVPRHRVRGHACVLGAAAAGAPQLRDPHHVAAGHCAGQGRAAADDAFYLFLQRAPAVRGACGAQVRDLHVGAEGGGGARPCRHCTMCEPCSQLVRDCPICRQPFERAVVLAAPPAAPQPASHWHGGLASTAKKTESVVNADSEEDDSENCKPEFDSTHQEINYTIHVVSKSPYMSVALER